MDPSLPLQMWAQQGQRVNCPLHPSEKCLFQSENVLVFSSQSWFCKPFPLQYPSRLGISEFQKQQNSGSNTQGASKSLSFCKSNGYAQRKQISTCFLEIITALQLVGLQRSERGGNLYRKSQKRAKKTTEDNCMPYTHQPVRTELN